MAKPNNNIETRIPKEDYYDLIQEQDYCNISQGQSNNYISNKQHINFKTNRLQQTSNKMAKSDLKINNKTNLLINKRDGAKVNKEHQNIMDWENTNKKL